MEQRRLDLWSCARLPSDLTCAGGVQQILLVAGLGRDDTTNHPSGYRLKLEFSFMRRVTVPSSGELRRATNEYISSNRVSGAGQDTNYRQNQIMSERRTDYGASLPAAFGIHVDAATSPARNLQ